MKVDLIILSKGNTDQLRNMTQACIDSCHQSEEDIKFDILVFEQIPNVCYDNCTTINYSDDFHYNRLMNRGISMTKNPYVCLCNNDLLFGKNWASKLIKAMGDKYLSSSPNHTVYLKEDIQEGYEIGYLGQVKGWCIFTDRKLYDIIGKIDESVNFWYSDNVYADQLKAKDIKHILVRHAFVKHLESVTLKQIDEKRRQEYTTGQQGIYQKNNN